MSTNLQICNRLASESRLTGSASAIATVVGQSGMSLRLVNWVKDAHRDIQRRHTNWRWMRSKYTVNTVANDDSYAYSDCTDTLTSAAISRFARWWVLDQLGAPNVKIYLTSGGVGGERWMTPIPWPYFYGLYKRGTQNAGPPVHVSIDPQNNLVLGPKPDAIYTVSGEYQRSALTFSADGDTPEFPADFHDLVWMLALEKYGTSSVAPENIARAKREGGRLMRQLEADQLPPMGMGAPLA